MDWSLLKSEASPKDATGVDGLIDRMERELRGDGPPIMGFRFLNDSGEMLRISREIEKEVSCTPRGADLYVGFQTQEKFRANAQRYDRHRRAGVRVAAFGQDSPADATSPADAASGWEGIWTPLARNTRALENHWFLVSSHPSPIAFVGWETVGWETVGWETSGEPLVGVGGLSAPGKQFRGFITTDVRVVHAVIAHLERVRAAVSQKSRNQPDGKVKRIMALTNLNDSPEFAAVRKFAAELAAANDGEVILFGMTSDAPLVSPYPEEDRREWIRSLREPELRRLGRSPLANQLQGMRSGEVDVQAVLPTAHGFKHLAEWAERENTDVILIPASLENPGLLDRLRGHSLKLLHQHTRRPVMVVYPNGSTRTTMPMGDRGRSRPTAS